MTTTYDPALVFEILNGAAMVSEMFFLFAMVIYLCRETSRRGIGVKEWVTWKLPPSMNFAIAVLVFDAGAWLRSLTVWVWRRFFGAHNLTIVEIGLLVASGSLLIVGSFCKLRAITKPDSGDAPWLASAFATALFIATSFMRR